MAYNKDNEEEQRLTPKQEKFVDGILEGKTQYQSYIDAYPKAKNWTRNSVDVRANAMMNNSKIILRLQEYGWKDKTKVLLTRERMLKRIDKVMTLHEEEMNRIQTAYQRDKALVMKELSQWMQLLDNEYVEDKEAVQQKINQLTKRLIDMDKIRTLNSTNTTGILKAADRINRMLGFDVTKVEISQADEERDEMEKLTADELKALINISKKED